MDLFCTKKNEDCNMLGPRFPNLPSESDVMNESWPINPDDIFDSIFSMDNDFFNSIGNQELELDDLTKCLKMEPADYKMNLPLLTDFKSECITESQVENISSTSSDSGLSSDNLDVDMSPTYEPFSPASSSPGPSVSEIGEKNEPVSVFVNKSLNNNLNIQNKKNEQKPKVVVQRVPQVLTLSTKPQLKQPKSNFSNKKEIKIVKLSPQLFTASNNKTVTIQVKNSNSGAKIQANPGTLFINKGKLTEVKKIVRVQNTTNPRSILIPVSLQDVKDLKSFKIINNTAFNSNSTYTTVNSFKTSEKCDETLSENSSDCESVIMENQYDCYDDSSVSHKEQYSQEKNYPKLILTPEERRLLSKEGITLPTHYPLTKNEERELKRIRRKIRNKISAQDSRKRKKEYVDGLEERVKQCTEENQTLMKRIKMLQSQNQNLVTQMKKLQSLITKGTNKTAQPTTCLMVLLLSLALVAAPNLKLGKNIQENEIEEDIGEAVPQNRRSLLFDVKEQNMDVFDEINMSDSFGMSDGGILGESGLHTSDTCAKNLINEIHSGEPMCKKIKQHRDLIDFDVDDQNWYKTKSDLDMKMSFINSYDTADDTKKNLKIIQTSGFNIDTQDLFDQDVLEMISPKKNGIYELNLENMPGFSHTDIGGVDIVANPTYTQIENDRKLNFSETQNF